MNNNSKQEIILVNFLQSWKEKDWNKMFQSCQKTWQNNHSLDGVTFLESYYCLKNLKKWKIIKIKSISNVCIDIKLKIEYGINGYSERKKIKARIICESEPYKTDINGNWGVNPISILKEN